MGSERPRRGGIDALSGSGAAKLHAPIRGRSHETKTIDEGFDAAFSGASAVTVLSGDPGIGKTRLLQHAVQHATGRGWSTLVVAPDIASELSPLGALISAATRSTPPLVTEEALLPVMQGPAAQYWLTRLLAESLEMAARASGVLVVVDDLQWLDEGSLGAIRALMHDLVGIPVFWLAATRTGVYSPGHQNFMSRVTDLGNVVHIAPLEPAAIDAMARDVLGSAPGPRVEKALERAAGYPLFLLELLWGLAEEGLLNLERGMVELQNDALPARFGSSARDRLRRVSRDALRIAQVGSLYGREFPLSGVLEIIGQTASAAAPAVQELLDFGFVSDTGVSLAFRHDTVQTAATNSLSPTLRRAMAREVIRRRLSSGEAIASLAPTIASVAEAGDDDSMELLLTAANEVATTDMRGAGRLVLVVARLTAGNRTYADRVAAQLPLLLAGGLVQEGMEISRAVGPLLSPDARGQLSLSLARQLTENDFDGAIRETSIGLAVPGISDRTRVSLLAVRALNYANKADEAGLLTALELARSAADDEIDHFALATIDATESVLKFNEGRFDEAEQLQETAVTRITMTGASAGFWMPEGLWLAFMRNSTGRCLEALRLSDEGLAAARAGKNAIAEAYWMMVRCRVLYDLGNVENARAEAETVFELGEQLGLGDFMNATAGVVLHRVALRTGDVALRDKTRPLMEGLAERAGLERTGRWSLAMEAVERGLMDKAHEYSSLAIASLQEAIPSMTSPANFSDDISLAYICRLADDTAALDSIVDVAQSRADLNPKNRFVAGIALATHGIRDRSIADLQSAAALLGEEERPLVTANVHEAVGIFAIENDTATTALSAALRLYERCGATRDASRILQMLRRRGVNRRLIGTPDPAGLTLRERQVAGYIHAGLTTQQIADELMVSPHTVVTYVRHIYAKWGVSSRREVAERFAT